MVANLDDALDVAASISHVCAALSDGGVACWGDNVFLPSEVDYYGSPLRVEAIENVVDVTVGAWYTCALTADQEIYCWGENGSYELGLGDDAPFFVDTPTRLHWGSAPAPI